MNRRQFLKTSGALGVALNPSLSRATRAPKVLVLGGTGFFGPVLVEELLRQGCAVTLFNRGKSNPGLFPQLERLVGDREDPSGCGLLALREDKRRWDWVVDTWQGSSKSVSEAAILLAGKCAQYQYVSTVSVYDKWDEVGITEDAALNPLPEEDEAFVSKNRYAIRKTFSEQVLRELMPTKFVFFRSHGMRGYPNTAPRHEPYWQVKIARGRNLVLPADISHYQVTDMVSLARFMVHCGENQIMGEYNVAYPPILFRKFIHGIVKHLKSQVKLHWIPQEFLLANNVKLMRATPTGRYRFSVDRALQAGLVNRPFEQLLEDQLKGYRDRHPNDDFVFGKPNTSTISSGREIEVIRLWKRELER